MTTPNSLVLRLGKLFLWVDAQRYDIYPRLLAAADLDRHYTAKELKIAVLGLTPHDDGKAYFRSEIGRNLGTCEVLSDGSVSLLGIGLTDTDPDGAVTFTQAARRLAQLYIEQPDGEAWKVALAEQLLRYEVRLRTLMRYLTRSDARLCFKGERFLGENPSAMGLMVLRLGADERQPLKESNGQQEPRPFTHALTEDLGGNIGPFWGQEFADRGLDIDQPWTLLGIKGDYPSNQDLAPRLRPQLILLHDLGLFRQDDDGWALDTAVFRQRFSAPLQADYLERSEEEEVFQLLQRAYGEGRRADGYIHAAELAIILADLLSNSPDDEHQFLSRWLARLEYQGRLQIIDHYRGLPGDGSGLHGDPNYQVIKLAFGGGQQ